MQNCDKVFITRSLKSLQLQPFITEIVSLQIYMDRNNVNITFKKSLNMLYFESCKRNKNIFVHKMTAGQSYPAEVDWSLFNIED